MKGQDAAAPAVLKIAITALMIRRTRQTAAAKQCVGFAGGAITTALRSHQAADHPRDDDVGRVVFVETALAQLG
jgi:hypothetical protein